VTFLREVYLGERQTVGQRGDNHPPGGSPAHNHRLQCKKKNLKAIQLYLILIIKILKLGSKEENKFPNIKHIIGRAPLQPSPAGA
jgi:hypothetical protein